MATWNSLYEQSPRNSNNPGYGAQAIRDVKTEIRARLQNSIVYGDGFIDFGDTPEGTLREGSARVNVIDGNEASREDRITAPTAEIGMVKVELEEMTDPDKDTYRMQNEVLSTLDDDLIYKKLSVVRYDSLLDSRVVTLFDYDQQVNLKMDQAVGGIKSFTHSPHVPNLGPWKTFYDENEKMGSAINIEEAYENHLVAALHNRWDTADDLNADNLVVDGNFPDGSGAYIAGTIRAGVVAANAIYGVVWV